MTKGRGIRVRSSLQMIEDRSRVAELRSQSFTFDQIADIMRSEGAEYYSIAMAKTDWKKVRDDWAKSNLPDTKAIVLEEISANDSLLRQAWRNYRTAMEQLEGIDFVEALREDLEPPEPEDPERPTTRVRPPARLPAVLRARRQAFTEATTWWKTIVDLRSQRARILGLNAGIVFNIDNRDQKVLVDANGNPKQQKQLPEKIYVGFNPDTDWPDAPEKETIAMLHGGKGDVDAAVEDGEYDDVSEEE